MRRSDQAPGGTTWAVFSSLVLAILLSGCGTLSSTLKADSSLTASGPAPTEAPAPPVALEQSSAPTVDPPTVTAEAAFVDPPGEVAALGVDASSEALLRVVGSAGVESPTWATGQVEDLASALAQQTQEPAEASEEEYDPWEPFNETMFEFNRNLDRFVLKPVARAYNIVMPEPWQVMIANGFDNIKFVPRVVNNVLQGKWGGAGRELGRFLINSTAGIGGLFDPAKDFWGIPKSNEDFGQTLGVWGSGPGPYLILPFLEPLTVRDGIGKFVDGLMDPLSYFLPFFWDRLGMKVGETVNDRALNYDLFQGFEESVIDMYSAVRHGYLQRRERLIQE